MNDRASQYVELLDNISRLATTSSSSEHAAGLLRAAAAIVNAAHQFERMCDDAIPLDLKDATRLLLEQMVQAAEMGAVNAAEAARIYEQATNDDG